MRNIYADSHGTPAPDADLWSSRFPTSRVRASFQRRYEQHAWRSLSHAYPVRAHWDLQVGVTRLYLLPEPPPRLVSARHRGRVETWVEKRIGFRIGVASSWVTYARSTERAARCLMDRAQSQEAYWSRRYPTKPYPWLSSNLDVANIAFTLEVLLTPQVVAAAQPGLSLQHAVQLCRAGVSADEFLTWPAQDRDDVLALLGALI